MLLNGSCHCGAVTYEVDAPHAYPFCLCYCNACRKTAGSGGYAINLGARAESLKVTGEDQIVVYRPGHIDEHDGSRSPQERHFCGRCGTALWIRDPRWPELVHPHAGAVDTELPAPPERTHLMLDFKPGWVPVGANEQDRTFERYPDESLAAWHERLGLVD